jgi:hypothetical protein
MDYKQKYLKYRQKYITLKKQIDGNDQIYTETSIRRLCFDIDPNFPFKFTKKQASLVGSEKFKKYEYILYISAQLSRLVFCDTGIMWHVIDSSLGLSNDIVNKLIIIYDNKFKNERITPIYSQKGNLGSNLPMESYSLVVAKKDDPKYATYISTYDNMACMILNASKIKFNPNSILLPTDVFVTFKGCNVLTDYENIIKSQFKFSENLEDLLLQVGVKIRGTNNKVIGSIVKDIIKGWYAIIKALTEHIKITNSNNEIRLFLTGCSTGGAYSTLFGLILAEGKISNTIPLMKNIKSIHIITFGSLTIFSETTRDLFNKHIDSGLITLDRIVNQAITTSSKTVQNTQAVLGIATLGLALFGPNDSVSSLPLGYYHAGYNIENENNEIPYSINDLRKFFGASDSNLNYRDPKTWPFSENINFDNKDYKNELNKEIEKIVNFDIKPYDLLFPQIIGAGEKKMSNFISHRGSEYTYGAAHAESFGLFYFGAQRIEELQKNPTPEGKIAYFSLCDSGVKIHYINEKSLYN